MASYAIGIDLGTTYSVVGVFRYGKVEIIANDFGNRTTPSIVGFDEIERLIGDSAKQQMISNPVNTIYGVKRLMGRNFTDDSLKEDKKFWPNTIFHNLGKAKIQVTYKNKMHVFTPEEISAMIILKMKQTAEDYLGKPVTSAVITVPAYFNDLQRKATKDAAEIAELNVLSIINEPTAAAIAYGFGNEHDGERNVLIFDLGGGTFDVSILVINKLNFEVIATGGDTHLGGEDFDNRLVQHFLSEIEFKFKIDLSKNKRALAKLRRACETAKRTLTLQTFAKIEVDALASGFDFNSTISRARFEEMNADLFKSTILTVGKVLSDAKLKKIEIDEVVLVGGSTRIPKIQKLIKDYFCGKEPVKSINPDEAIAFGAAVQAARILGDTSKEICEMVLSDVTPLSLGIGNVPNFETMGVIIRRNTKIPVKIVRICKTTFDNQTSMTIRVFQGESVKTAENILIGDFSLQGFPPRVAGKEEAEVIFEINENGILKVSICSLTTAKEASMTIDTKGYLTNQQIEKMIKKSQEINMDDNSRREAVVARNDFETYCCMVKTILEKEYSSNSSLDLAEVLNNLSNSLKWLDLNSNATREDYAREKEMLEKMCDSFILQEILD